MSGFIQPTEPVLYHFYPAINFYEESLNTQYIANERYSVRAGNDKLDKLVKQWKIEGKVR